MKEYLNGLRSGIPICLGYISVSFAFGIAAAKGGLSLINAVIISMTNLTSAGQLAGLDIIKSNGGLIELTIAMIVINIRYMLMSLALSQKIDTSIGTTSRLLMSFGITDEIFAVSMQKREAVSFVYFLGLMTLPYIGWSLGTFLGAYASSVLPESIRLALGIAIYAMFIAIIVPPAKRSRQVLVVILIAILVSCLISALPVLCNMSSGWRIIISTIAGAGTGAIIYPERQVEV